MNEEILSLVDSLEANDFGEEFSELDVSSLEPEYEEEEEDEF